MLEQQRNGRARITSVRRELTAVALILLAALGIRTVSIGEESAWFDEVSTLQHLDSGSLAEFLTRCKDYNPVPPVYLAAEYAWSRLWGTGVLPQRMLSLLFGIASIVALYGFVRCLFGSRAAGFAALWMALMPWHVFHSQEIRFYALTTLFGVLSAWSFAALMSAVTLRRCLVNCAANVLLAWTYPLAAFAVATQGIFFLLRRRGERRTLALWLVAHALLAASLYVFLAAQDLGRISEITQYMRRPTVLGRDTSVQSYLMVASGAWKINGSPEAIPFTPWGRALYRFYPAVSFLLALVTYFAACFAVFESVRRHDSGNESPTSGLRRRESILLLVLWFAVPPLCLFIGSFVWRPMFTARYILFATPALYALIGVWLASRRRIVAAAVIALPAALYLAFYFPGPVRAPWERAVEIMHANSGPAPTIYVELPFAAPSITYYWEGPVPHIHETDLLAELLAGRGVPEGECWIVTSPYGDAIVRDEIEKSGNVTGHWRLERGQNPVSIIHWHGSR